MPRYFIPLVVFVALVIVFGIGLYHDPHIVPSPLINKPLPEFRLPRLDDGSAFLSNDDLKGKPVLINVWASWCVSCREEHPILMEVSKQHQVPIYGLDYKDERDAAQKWLTQRGDPYFQTAVDSNGRVGIDLGVYGVPETFVVDANGVIRYKQIGPITQNAWNSTILPLLKQLGATDASKVN